MNYQSETTENNNSPDSNINKDNRKKVIILERSLLNCINEKGFSKK